MLQFVKFDLSPL